MKHIKLNGITLIKNQAEYILIHDGFKIVTQDVNFAIDYLNLYA